jgi:dTMP kinase
MSNTSKAGLFLALEGVEGSGKTTQARLLVESLRAQGHDVVAVREPGGTPLGEKVRGIFQMDAELDVPPRSELFLLLASRAALIQDVIRPALDEGKIVVADRFELSTLAYQGAGRGLPLDEIQEANRIATGGLSPNATLLLSLDPAEGDRRQAAMGKTRDRMELAGEAFHRRVGEGYERLSTRVPGVVRLDAAGDFDTVHRRIQEALSARFPGRLEPTARRGSVGRAARA